MPESKILNATGAPAVKATPDEKALAALTPHDRLCIDLFNSLDDQQHEDLKNCCDIVARLSLNEQGNPELIFQREARVGAAPIDKFTLDFYNVLTSMLRAALAAGARIVANLTQTPDGTLSVNVQSCPRVRHVDFASGRVYFYEDQEQEASGVPAVAGEPADAAGEGDSEAGTALRDGQSPQGA